jgi:hypothetical protein
MSRRALYVVACLLLAGCGGVSTGGGPALSPTETVTPAPLPTETASVGSPTPPAGTPVDRAALTSLPADHAASLSNRSYTVVERRVVLDESGALYDRTETLRVAPTADGARYRYERTRIADPSYPGPQGIETLSLYHAGNRTAFRDEDDGGVRYGVVEGPFRFGPGPDHTGAASLEDLLNAFGSWTVAPVEDGRVVRGRGLVDETRLDLDRRLGSPGDASVSVRVIDEGRVSRLHLEYAAILNDRRVMVRVDRQYTAVGSTAVPEPAWLPRALGTETSSAEVWWP